MPDTATVAGVDLGSSGVRFGVLPVAGGRTISAGHPRGDAELSYAAAEKGWAEQDPMVWWSSLKEAVTDALAQGVNPDDIEALGIGYQMHGLVCTDANGVPLRKAIIWCDNRAWQYGNTAADALADEFLSNNILQSPANFTAAKFGWVADQQPDIAAATKKIMLPGDWLAGKLTGDFKTTASGLSEGIMWDFANQQVAQEVLDQFGIQKSMVPDLVDTFGHQGVLSKAAADELGLRPGIPVTFRAGDQPVNALALNVLDTGQVAVTAGTSGVAYAVTDKNVANDAVGLNTFVHVNNTASDRRNGILLCINGAGSAYSFLKRFMGRANYVGMNAEAETSPIGSNGLTLIPFGVGGERMLKGAELDANLFGLNFNLERPDGGIGHQPGDAFRACLEGVASAMAMGMEEMGSLGVEQGVIRAARANMFLSDLFCQALADMTGRKIQLYNTDNVEGAARGAGVGAGVFSELSAAFAGLSVVKEINPDPGTVSAHKEVLDRFKVMLAERMAGYQKQQSGT